MIEDFENIVGQALARLCGDGECLERNKVIIRPEKPDKSVFLFVDFYLPQGCKALDLPKETCVEVKRRMTYNALSQIRILCDQLPGKNLVIVTREPFEAPNYEMSLRGITKKDRNVRFIPFPEIEQRLAGVKNKEKTVEITFQPDCEDKKTETTIREKAAHDFAKGNITLFLGAGVSASADLPSWDNLLEGMLEDTDVQAPLAPMDYPAIGVAAYNSAIITARYLLAAYEGRADKDEKIVNRLSGTLYKNYKGKLSELLKTIAQMCGKTDAGNRRLVQKIVTLNYDDLMEDALNQKNIPCQTIFGEGRYEADKLPVVHVHGILKRKEAVPVIPVLSEDSYHNLYRQAYGWANIEMLHAFYRTTCIFIGLSMSDPNLRRLLEFVKSSTEEVNHYAILPQRALSNHNWDSWRPHKYYEKDAMKEQLFVARQENVFKQLGINVIWYEDGKYDQIPEILKEIAGM